MLPIELGVTSTFVYTKEKRLDWDMKFKEYMDSLREERERLNKSGRIPLPFTSAVEM